MEISYLPDFNPGNTVFGRYRIIKCLGIGSIGTVYSCELITNPEERIALKVLSPKAASDPKILAAFRNEISASYRVSNVNVVRCYEFFRDEDVFAISMEHVDGPSLANVLQGGKALPIEQAESYLRQFANGLAAIHRAGIIHHDLKPQNILIDSNDTLKIADFTAAHIGLNRQYSSSGSVFGTIQFLSPETIMYGWVDRRSDIYGFGVITYLMLTGLLPFAGEDVVSQVHSKMHAKLIPPHLINPACPYLLSKLVMKAMARQPESRFQSVDEILHLLDSVDLSYKPGFFDKIFGNPIVDSLKVY